MILRKIKMARIIKQVVKDMQDWPMLYDEKYGSVSWSEADGWRGRSYYNNKFYFNDYPEDSFLSNFDVLIEMESNGK